MVIFITKCRCCGVKIEYEIEGKEDYDNLDYLCADCLEWNERLQSNNSTALALPYKNKSYNYGNYTTYVSQEELLLKEIKKLCIY